jgi:murein DD-endopeptidase MepM/ murein hydrolase activator NlpD
VEENKKEKKSPKAVYRKLINKYKLVVMNEETYEEKVALRLSPMNIFTWGGSIIIFVITSVTILIAFTPLREYIPGYSDITMRRNATYAALKADSLEEELRTKEIYFENLKAIINGEPLPKYDSGDNIDSSKNYSAISISHSPEDSVLREQIESEEKYNIVVSDRKNVAKGISSYFFFTPLKGLVTSKFSAKDNHFGVDIVAPKNEVVKAALDGVVVLATWTSETGHVIQIQHENNILSVYKHNSVRLKKEGEFVKAGEAIAIIGESGELSSGPHLHFELWYNGKPLNPEDYILF